MHDRHCKDINWYKTCSRVGRIFFSLGTLNSNGCIIMMEAFSNGVLDLMNREGKKT